MTGVIMRVVLIFVCGVCALLALGINAAVLWLGCKLFGDIEPTGGRAVWTVLAGWLGAAVAAYGTVAVLGLTGTTAGAVWVLAWVLIPLAACYDLVPTSFGKAAVISLVQAAIVAGFAGVVYVIAAMALRTL